MLCHGLCPVPDAPDILSVLPPLILAITTTGLLGTCCCGAVAIQPYHLTQAHQLSTDTLSYCLVPAPVAP